jgi:hypothetical protein
VASRLAADGTRYLHLCWQASENGRELEPLKHRKAGDFRDVPVPDMIWDMVQELPDGPLCPGPNGIPYMPYSTAGNRFGRMLDYIHASANAEQRIGAMMNARWTSSRPAGRHRAATAG